MHVSPAILHTPALPPAFAFTRLAPAQQGSSRSTRAKFGEGSGGHHSCHVVALLQVEALHHLRWHAAAPMHGAVKDNKVRTMRVAWGCNIVLMIGLP